MRTGFLGRVVMFAVVLAVAGLLVGCSTARRTQSRMSVLQAENVDLTQRTNMAEEQARDATLGQDRTLVELQQEKHRAAQLDSQLTDAEQQALRGNEAVAELEQSRHDTVRNAGRIQGLIAKIDKLERQSAVPKPRSVAPSRPDAMAYQPSPHLDAFAQDLRGQLGRAGINLPVETRTTRDGRRRVAVVLTNAFPAGKDSLSYNMDAARAVVGLGRLVASSYPSSQVSVEGHTDADPIRVSNFASNEALSLSRARSVKALLAKAGIRESLIEVEGNGARYPLASGKTARAKAQNRRVEIYIEPST